MQPAERLLACLDNVHEFGPGRWTACCPAHDSASRASLAIRELDDGRMLVHDFGGCDVEDVLGAVGLTTADLFPDRAWATTRGHRPAFSARQALEGISFEALIVLAAARLLMARGEADGDLVERLQLAVARIGAALDACHA